MTATTLIRATGAVLLFGSMFLSGNAYSGDGSGDGINESGAESIFESRIVNGLMTSDLPTTGAMLLGNSQQSASSWCSGTMIGCETFAVAAHCVCNSTGSQCQPGDPGEPDPTDYFVYLQHSGVHAVSSVSVHPSFDFPVADVALLKLSTPVDGISPTPINTTQDPALGTTGIIAGFGRSGGNEFDYGLKRFGEVVTATCPAGVSNATSVCWRFDNPIGAPGTDSNTCNADSGGPLFIDFGQGDVLAGITSGGENGQCLPLDRSYDTNVWFYQNWIATTGGADLANTTCGARSQVGDADTLVDGFVGSVTASTPEGRHSIVVDAATDALVVGLNAEDDGSQRFDLYVKDGAPPTVSDFDCSSNGTTQYEACEFAAPTAGTWHILVNRVSGNGDYQVTATQFTTSGPVGTVEIDLSSVVTTVPHGGSYPFTLGLSNETGANQVFILSIRLIIPDGTVFPLLAAAELTFPDGGVFSTSPSLPVSAEMPVGDYTLVGLVIDPNTLTLLHYDTTSFAVTLR